MKLFQFNPCFQEEERDIEQYHGKDIVHWGYKLILDPALAWKKIEQSARKNINKAKTLANVKIIKVKGTKEDIRNFRQVWYDPEDSTLAESLNENQIMYLAYLENELVGGMILTPTTPVDLFLHNLGANQKGKDNNIPALLLWQAVEELKDSQYKFIDIGVCFRQSLYRWFKKWQTSRYPIVFQPPLIKPNLRLVPFENESLNLNVNQKEVEKIDEQIKEYLGDDFTYFPEDIYAMTALLKHLKLTQNDEVAVFKTFQADSLPPTVAESIELVCRWDRKITPQTTKAVLVIHEFGFPCQEIFTLKEETRSLGIPLIEDCSWSMGGKINNTAIGKIGDFTIYSLSKIFPMQYGAILKGKFFTDEEIWNNFGCLDFYKREIVKKELTYHFPKLEEYNLKRRENWYYLNKFFTEDGILPYCQLAEGVFPAGYCFKTDSLPRDSQFINKRFLDFGIESRIYPENNSLLIPCHQNLSQSHLDYIFGCLRGVLNLFLEFARPKK